VLESLLLGTAGLDDDAIMTAGVVWLLTVDAATSSVACSLLRM
jgi:hypothetical protein